MFADKLSRTQLQILPLLPIFLTELLSASAAPHFIQYIHPLPDSRYVSAKSSIILRFQNAVAVDPSAIYFDVHGSLSGAHQGNIIRSGNRSSLVFKPENPFTPDESITVTLHHQSLTDGVCTHQFHVSGVKDQEALNRQAQKMIEDEIDPGASQNLQTCGEVTTLNGVTVPSDFPVIEIEGDPENTAPGKIFTAFREKYIAILQNDGTPYYYQKSRDFLMDFKVQPNGMLSRNVDNNFTNEHFYVTMDSSFNIVDTFTVVHGYATNHHDFLLLPNGHALMIANDSQIIDMSEVVEGGRSDMTVAGNHIQEVDADNEIVWEWLCWDHYNVEDAVHEDLTGSWVDYTHMNSIAVDYDSNLVVSCRNLSECSKINWKTGDFIWRMGGVHNEFEFINDTDMNSYQHMFKPVHDKPNHYTLFDNGNYHNPRYSRAVEFFVDTEAMTVEKVWEYRAAPDYRVDWLGGVQRLSNNNTLICWGGHALPFATEVSPDGELLYQATSAMNIASYRSYRFDWQGVSDEPYLLAETDGEKITLIMNKFGDMDVNYYKIYSGPSETQLTFSDTTSQTRYDLVELTARTDYYFQVTAVNGSGIESPPSEIEHVYIDFLGPHGEIIENGAFRNGDAYWEFAVSGDAEATAAVEAGRYHVSIERAGALPENIHVKQGGIPLYQGQTYVFEFHASGETARTIEALIQDNDPPFTNYGHIGFTYILDQRIHFTYTFTMEDETDFEAEVLFNCGAHSADVYLDNISLSVTTPVPEIPHDQKLNNRFQLNQNYPNPFNGMTKIGYTLYSPGHVHIRIYNALGQIVQTENLSNQTAGHHAFHLKPSALATGLYFYQMDFRAENQTMQYSEMKKMIYIQ